MWALEELAKTHEAAGRWSDLAELYTEQLETIREPVRRAKILCALARVLYQHLDDEEGALQLLVEALFETPDDLAILRAAESLADATDRFAHALQTLNAFTESSALDARPRDRVTLLLHTAHWYARTGHPEYAAARLEKAKSLAPADPQIARAWERLVAARHESANDAGDALEAARKRVLALDPTDLAALAGLIELHRERGTLESVASYVQDLVGGSVFARLNPARVLLAAVCEELGQLDRAVSILEEGRTADATDTNILRALDRVYRARGSHADLIRVIEARLVHDRDLDRAVATLRIARILDEEFCDPARAAARLAELLLDEPDAPEAYLMQARLQSKLRAFDAAIETLEHAVEALSDVNARAEACVAIARIALDELSQPTRAVEVLERARSFAPDGATVLEVLVRAHAAAGDLPSSLAVMVHSAARRKDADALVLAANQHRTVLADRPTARRIYLQALDLEPSHLAALDASRTLSLEAEDWDAAARFLDRLQRQTAGDATRARLLVELGVLRRERLGDEPGALQAFEEALSLDAENTVAALAVAEAYIAAARWDDAASTLSPLARASRPPEQRRRILELEGRIAATRGDHEKAHESYKRAVQLGSRAPGVMSALSDSAAAAGSLSDALAAQRMVLSTIPPENLEARVTVLTRLAELEASLGDRRSATRELEQALAIDPGNRRVIEAVFAIAVGLRDWTSVAAWEQIVLRVVDEPEARRTFLRASADRWLNEANDRARAIDALEHLLAIEPEDRAVLHEILAHHQALRNFRGVSRALERIVALDPDPARRAKYLIAAAKVQRDELRDDRRAVDLFDCALDDDPLALEAFRALETILTRKKDFRHLERAYRKMVLRARRLGAVDLEFRLWHALGLIYRDRLLEPAAAIEAFRMASALRPDDEQERRIVAQLYETADRSDLAVAELLGAIDRDPLVVQHHRALHALHLRRGDLDRAWLTASTLVALGAADAEIRARYDAERPSGLPPFGARLLPGCFQKLLSHPDLDRSISAIFAVIADGARVAKARMGTATADVAAEDPEAPSHPAAWAFFRVAQVLGIEPPLLRLRRDLPGAFAPVPAERATTVLGATLLDGWTEGEIGFLAAKHLVSLTDEHAMRAHFPSKTQLRAFLVAGVSLGLGAEPEAQPGISRDELVRIARALASAMEPGSRALLAVAAKRFAEASGRADVSMWMHASELTALRAAIAVTGDLPLAARIVRMEPAVAGDLSPADKLRDLIRFAVSERHHEIRKLLQIDVREAPASTVRPPADVSAVA